MIKSSSDRPENKDKKIVHKISVICLSEEFDSLRKELEELYISSNVQDPRLNAFQDALYSILSQHEDVELCKVKAF